MSKRFENLRKIPDQPAARLLAAANAHLETEISLPVSASVSAVLAELETASAPVDMIRLLSVALPPRECVWWACIAGRELVGPGGKSDSLAAAEAWVFEPNEDRRAHLKAVMDSGARGDKAAPCATAAYYAPGNMGPGDMKDHPAPPGVVASCAFGLNLKTLALGPDPQARFDIIIERALDIARGGNGKLGLKKSDPDDHESKEGGT
ncbi:MAG: hypothetical protein GJ676_08685 [Rhodobacteraceae bacterium]|nr:hypothetical protein [Paracoccaceae bacterium]